MEVKNTMIKHITINQAVNGYVLSVGQQQLVFDDPMLMLICLSAYLENPKQKEEEWEAYSRRPVVMTRQPDEDEFRKDATTLTMPCGDGTAVR